jgi:hypothetical protein
VLRRLASALLLRTLTHELHAISDALDRQNALLARLVDRFVPAYPDDRETLHRDTGVSHLDPVDAGLALDFVEKSRHDTGHTPDDEEILIYLADEKTTDLHRRLIERDEELARLAEARR